MALNNVPLTGQTLNTTRDAIRDNFAVINTAFEIDHVTYGDPDQGKHNQITFTDLGGAQPATAGQQLLLYNNNAQLFLQNNSNDNIPVTQATINALNGFYNLWSGHKIRFGQLTATGSTTVAWPTPFSGTPSVVQLTVDSTSSPNLVYWNMATTTAAVLGVKVVTPSNAAATATFYFWALGPI